MSAGEAVRAALAEAVRVALPGVATGEAGLPRVAVELLAASDWGTETEAGRELRLVTAVRVTDGQAGRLPALVTAIEGAGVGLAGAIGGWRVASAVLVRTRPAVERGVRVATVEHRVRVLAA